MVLIVLNKGTVEKLVKSESITFVARRTNRDAERM
jgi:hypothetical protein